MTVSQQFNDEIAKCSICGEPMPQGETMFKYHGYSGPCPKPPLLQPHQRRVVDEKVQLDDKLAKLKAFGSTPLFDSLPTEEKQRLTEQEMHMRGYSEVLGARIAAFS